jgi:hypothetical protein
LTSATGGRLAGRLGGLEHVERDDLGRVGHAHGVQCASDAEPVPAPRPHRGIAWNRVPASADGPTMLRSGPTALLRKRRCTSG